MVKGIPLPITRRKTSIYDANTLVPESITQELIDRILKLPDCPEVRYLHDQFLSKFVSDETDPASVRRQRAINKWLAVERDNEATNDRLFSTDPEYNILPRVTWQVFLDKLQRVVREIVGDVPPEEALIGSFSGGASTSRTRASSHPAGKYLGQADITPAARVFFEESISLMPGWASHEHLLSIREVPGNVLFTVPKNTAIDRCACKEPDINMFLQKGVGSHLRRRLRNFGVDLNNQERNKTLARTGSLTGNLATLDLSSASDSVSSALVELALPPLWYSLLNGLRSPVTMIDGEEHVNEMFSSMGNGFTFELESLLFFCIARTCAYFRGVSGIISVYGDDIICPSELAFDLEWVLEYLGFSVNPEKSFYSGPFRESCGGHFYNGYDITPFYLRSPIKRLTDIIHIANAIRRWSARIEIGVLSPLLEDTWVWLASHVPKGLWGGHDTGSILQLVAPVPPKAKLEPKRGAELTGSRLDIGVYLLWLNSTWMRDIPGEAVETSRLGTFGTRYRIRPARKGSRGSVTPFLGEV